MECMCGKTLPTGNFMFGEEYTCDCGLVYYFQDMDEGKGMWFMKNEQSQQTEGVE